MLTSAVPERSACRHVKTSTSENCDHRVECLLRTAVRRCLASFV